MNIIIKTILALTLLIVTVNAEADIAKCVGSASDGFAYVILDTSHLTITTNGSILKIVALNKTKTGVCTEDYIDMYQEPAYQCFNKSVDGITTLEIFNSKTNKLMTLMALSCVKVG